MRCYHNTILRNEPAYRDYFLFGLGAVGLKHTERDVFNNIFVSLGRMPGSVVLGKEAGVLREGGNILWGLKADRTTPSDPFAKLRKSPLFPLSKAHYEPGWTTNDMAIDPGFVSLAVSPNTKSDLRLSNDSPAINAGQTLPNAWPDPLHEKDLGQPDIGAIPFGTESWMVGVDGRIPVGGGG
jgi:hypothetical protein